MHIPGAKLPPKGLVQAIYALGNRTALTRYAEDGRPEIDTGVFDGWIEFFGVCFRRGGH